MSFTGERIWSKTVEGKLYNGPVQFNDKLLIGIALGTSPLQVITSAGQDVWTFIPPE
jgi:hypothetical protein